MPRDRNLYLFAAMVAVVSMCAFTAGLYLLHRLFHVSLF